LFDTIPSEKYTGVLNEICCFAVDENDNVYIVVEFTPRYDNVPPRNKLVTLDANGNVKEVDRFLDVIETPEYFPPMKCDQKWNNCYL
jgi:hypothetical protein